VVSAEERRQMEMEREEMRKEMQREKEANDRRRALVKAAPPVIIKPVVPLTRPPQKRLPPKRPAPNIPIVMPASTGGTIVISPPKKNKRTLSAEEEEAQIQAEIERRSREQADLVAQDYFQKKALLDEQLERERKRLQQRGESRAYSGLWKQFNQHGPLKKNYQRSNPYGRRDPSAGYGSE
jgi:hypothetical protein